MPFLFVRMCSKLAAPSLAAHFAPHSHAACTGRGERGGETSSHPAWWGDDSSVPPAGPGTVDGSVDDPDVRHTQFEPWPLDGPPVSTLYLGRRPFSSWPSRPNSTFASRGVVAIMRRWPMPSIFKITRASRDAATNLARRAGNEACYYLAADMRLSCWARLAARLVWAAAVVVVQAAIMACLTMALLGLCMAIRACALARVAADRTTKGV